MKAFLLLMALALPPIRAEVIRLGGSDTLGAKLVPQLCEAYRAEHPETKFEIAAEGASTSVPDLLSGRIDILMANRVLKPAEMKSFQQAGITLTRSDAAGDVLVIVVNATNPVRDLTLAQLEGLFTGDIPNWKDVGGTDAAVKPFTRNTASETYRAFQVLAMNGRPYAKGVTKMPGGEPPPMVVAKEAQGIAYIGLAYARAKGIAVVRIDGIDPTGKDVARYPLLRHNYYYHRSNAPAGVRDFVRWAGSSPEAKKTITRLGFLEPQAPAR